MDTNRRSIQLEQAIKASPEVVFAALTRPGDLQHWFADFVVTQPRAGGRYVVSWHSGYEAYGRFTEFDKPARVAFTWLGTGEPTETTVIVTLEPTEDGTHLALTHAGFGDGAVWDQTMVEAEKGWIAGLQNLLALVEDGVDLRLARQPFLGVNLDELTAERAEKEGIGTATGIYIEDTVEGYGAQEAGLQSGDVIVRLGEQEVSGFETLVGALREHQAGDIVPVRGFRGQEPLTIDVKLSSRPSPDVPDEPAEAAARLRERYAAFQQALHQTMDGVSEELAGRQPAPGEWSARETTAHLCWTERDNQFFVGAMLVGDGPHLTENPDVVPEKLAALIARYPTVPELITCLESDQAETAALIEAITPETLAYKWRYRYAAQWALELVDHADGHLNQIRDALEMSAS